MTTTNAHGTNYRETYFQHADLTPIRGKPKNDSLKILIHELSANAQTVHSNLGGGANGHLGLILMPAKYAPIAPGTPYNRPVYPGALVIPPATTNVQAQMMREQHQQDLQVFHESEAVHNALVQQVVKAVEPMYLKAMRNPVTQAFLVPLSEILQHLMTVYGKLNPRTLLATKNALETFQYNVQLPVDVVFDPIDDLAELAEVAGEPMTEAQKRSMAFIIFQNTGKFKSDLKSWNRKSAADRTWDKMKSHFRDALQDARDVEDAPVGQTFDQANMINEVLDGVRAIVRDQVAEALPHVPQPFHLNNQHFGIPPPYGHDMQPHQPATQQANMTYDMYQPANYANQVQQVIPPPSAGLQNQPPPNQHNGQQNGFSNFGQRGRGNRGRQNGRGNRGGRGGRGGYRNQGNHNGYPQVPPQMQQPYPGNNTPPFPQGLPGNHQGNMPPGYFPHGLHNQAQPRNPNRNGPTRRNVSYYCWSHGACAHPGTYCMTPLPGHVANATFQNRYNGCTDFCE